ncbi:MAG: hypothetical protein ACFFCD_16745 [Promethearchaeota archaeon]
MKKKGHIRASLLYSYAGQERHKMGKNELKMVKKCVDLNVFVQIDAKKVQN